ncbi:MAG: NosD domain-containing protein [Dehalococcoidia bacterium]
MKKLTIVAILALLASLTALSGGLVSAAHCTTTVTAPSSIQTAVDAASPGDVVCLDDSGGVFSQTVVFGPEDSGITLTAEDGDTPVMDGGSAALDAIRFLNGVSDVTIEGLTIQNYGSGSWTQPGNAIQAWDVSTSNITIRNNVMDDFSWNAVLVGSEGGFVHDNWMVKNNTVRDATFVGIELTNCEECTIMKNDVDPSLLGIVVQARNTVAGSGAVVIDGVHILHNTVDNAVFGIYVLSFTGHPTLFTPITGASSLLSSVSISHNTVTDSGAIGVLFWAFNAEATAKNGRIMKNVINCPATTLGDIGVGIFTAAGSTVKNVKVVNNSFADCDTNVIDGGDATKQPPGPF